MSSVDVIAVILFFGGLIALLIFLIKKLMKATSANRLKKRNDLMKYSHKLSGSMKHIEGLPIAKGLMVELFYGTDKITFRRDRQEISLSCDKIHSMDTCTGPDIKNQMALGAIAGKYVTGGFGSATRGMLLMASTYFVISYKNDNETKFIFLDTESSGLLASKIIKDFGATHYRKTERIEL